MEDGGWQTPNFVGSPGPRGKEPRELDNGQMKFMMWSMKAFHLLIVFVASCFLSNDSVAQQSALDSAVSVPPPPTFAEVVNRYFSQWDANGDGVLSKDEIDAAVANPKFHDEAAAAIAIIRMVVHGGKYKLPPITQAYLVSDLSRGSSTASEPANLDDDLSKPEQNNLPPAFQPRYLQALGRLHQASRELFAQSMPSLDAVHQAGLGDCSFLSTVGGMVYHNPSGLKAMFTQNGDGSTTVAFGNGQRVSVAGVTDADIIICSTAGKNGLWLTTLEKAYRKFLLKLHSDQPEKTDIYDRMNGPAVEILDGQQTREIRLRKRRGDPQLAVTVRQALRAAQQEQRLVKAGTPEIKETPGISPGHDYAILGYDGDTDLVHVWNPHSNNFTPEGSEGLQNGYATKSGQFNIPCLQV
jgi:hypothetical protein